MGAFIAIKIFAKLKTGNSPKRLKELKVASSFSFAGVKNKVYRYYFYFSEKNENYLEEI